MKVMRRRRFKLKISEYGILPEDREAILKKHMHIADLKLKAKNVSKDNKDLINIFRNEIQSVRQNLMDNYAHKFFLATIMLGPHKEEKYFSYYPTSDDITNLKEILTRRLSKDRAAKKELYRANKNFNGIEYEMVGRSRYGDDDTRGLFRTADTIRPVYEVQAVRDRGGLTWQNAVVMETDNKEVPKKQEKKKLMPTLKGGGNVFMEPGSILKFLDGPGYARRIHKSKKPYDKSNYVGVEIELICKASRETLEEAFVAARLAGNVYLKDDTSIQRETEGEWTHEITMIGKQQNINDVITRVCNVLNSKEIGSYVNDSCGIHVHVDMRNRNYPVCFKNFVNSLPVLMAMVPASRLQSKYCVPNESDDYSYSKGNGSLDRRQAINPLSFGTHKTVEIRMHSGSTNAMKINYWVNVLTAIADHTAEVNVKVMEPADMQRIFGIDSKTVEYIVRRIDKFKNNKALNTKDDHLDQSA